MKKIKLNNGVEMPLLGFGTYKLEDPSECEARVMEALEMGYRLIDTAQMYGNEAPVGAAIQKSGVPREEIFLTTKIWFRSFETSACRKSLSESFARLGTAYIDLVLLHWPFGDTYAAWRVLEEFLRAGKIRAIGVSNFQPSQLVDFVEFHQTVPAVNQIEMNLLGQQKELRTWMKKYNIAPQAYTPFGRGRANEMFEQPSIKRIAEIHGRTTRQIALQFLMQEGVSVIPKASSIEHMRENLTAEGFTLSAEEMEELRSMDENRIVIGLAQDPAAAEAMMQR